MNRKPQVTKATFKQWNKPSPAKGTDLRERGTDLKIRVENWPKAYNPSYIVFRHKKSLQANITKKGKETVIKARIIKESAILKHKLVTLNVSNRLVYTTKEGSKDFIEIKDWDRMGN